MEQPVVKVVWIDSMITDMTPVAEGDALDYATITSVGYVVEETDTMLALARERTMPMKHWRGVVCIPKVAITSRRTLAAVGSAMTRHRDPTARCDHCSYASWDADRVRAEDAVRAHVQRDHPSAFNAVEPTWSYTATCIECGEFFSASDMRQSPVNRVLAHVQATHRRTTP
jgi:hypothetical protein